ncbi:MAG: nitroreductase [Solobacterium sp.]|nr:nitroreductase [Solobacterium sp.]
MNETMKTILSRKSTKKYLPTPVEPELIEQIVQAGVYAPTGMGKQSPIILAVTNKEVRDQLSRINAGVMGRDMDPFYGAPAVLVVLARKDVPTYIYDGSCVIENMLIAAHSLGLGACWIHRAKEEFESEEGLALLKSLGIEDEYEGIGNVILGYPDGPAHPDVPRKEGYIYYVK